MVTVVKGTCTSDIGWCQCSGQRKMSQEFPLFTNVDLICFARLVRFVSWLMEKGYRKYSKKLEIYSLQTCSNFASTRSKKSIYWPTLKFSKTSNFGKGGTPGYCIMAIYSSWTVPDNNICTWITHDTVTKKARVAASFYTEPSKMATEYAPIWQKGSNFLKKTAKKFALSPKFQKIRFEVHKNEYLRYMWVCVTCVDCTRSTHHVD